MAGPSNLLHLHRRLVPDRGGKPRHTGINRKREGIILRTLRVVERGRPWIPCVHWLSLLTVARGVGGFSVRGLSQSLKFKNDSK